MESISAIEQARELLGYCLRGEPWPEPLAHNLIAAAATDAAASRALFTVVVERLGDLFEPALCDTYAELFARAIEYVDPELRAKDLVHRYRRARIPRRCTADPLNVFVLSRITLGADVVVTSTLLGALAQRFPDANLWFVGPRKNWALFAGHPRVTLLATDYPRGGTLADRVAIWRKLQAPFAHADGIVVDTDSRLSQLGLLPLCDEDRYFFFESRGYGGDSDETLAELTRRWTAEVFDIPDARPFVAPAVPPGNLCDVTISFGVGENEEKRIADPFERSLLEALSTRALTVDTGAGGAEADRVRTAAAGLPNTRTWEGDYAPFAALIRNSRLYIGYDSAGQHVAAAAGVPLVSVFAGYAADRMFQRWRPSGIGPAEVVKVAPGESPAAVLERTLAAISAIVARPAAWPIR